MNVSYIFDTKKKNEYSAPSGRAVEVAGLLVFSALNVWYFGHWEGGLRIDLEGGNAKYNEKVFLTTEKKQTF